MTFDREGLCESFLYTLDGTHDIFLGYVGLQEESELVTAEPGYCVAGAQSGAQPARNFDQHLIACRVAEAIIDNLEVVQVEEHHCDIGASAAGRVDSDLEPVVEEHPVRQACEGV